MLAASHGEIDRSPHVYLNEVGASSSRELDGWAPCDPKNSIAPQAIVMAMMIRSSERLNGSGSDRSRAGMACKGSQSPNAAIAGILGGGGTDGSGLCEVSMGNRVAGSW
jgi:hypothetical protein